MPEVFPQRNTRVLIENPAPGGQPQTSLARALRYERQGKAIFLGPTLIRFLDSAAQLALVQRCEAEQRARISAGGYDQIDRILNAGELRHLPLINAQKMIREEKSSRDWSYSASVLRRNRRDHSAGDVAAIRALQGGGGGSNPAN